VPRIVHLTSFGSLAASADLFIAASWKSRSCLAN
jgi:hypothetical protein